MIKATMQALVTAITNAGYPATIRTVDGTDWIVTATAQGFTINVNAVKTLADAQGVTAKVSDAEFT